MLLYLAKNFHAELHRLSTCISSLQKYINMSRGVRGVVRCTFGSFLAPHFAVRFIKTITTPHFIFAVTCVVRYGAVRFKV